MTDTGETMHIAKRRLEHGLVHLWCNKVGDRDWRVTTDPDEATCAACIDCYPQADTDE